MLLFAAGLFLSGFVSGYLISWLRYRPQRHWLRELQSRKNSLRFRPTYFIRLARHRRMARDFGGFYGHFPQQRRSDFF